MYCDCSLVRHGVAINKQVSEIHIHNSLNDKQQPMHFTFNNILVYNADFNVKIHKNTATCFDLNRSSSGSMSIPR